MKYKVKTIAHRKIKSDKILRPDDNEIIKSLAEEYAALYYMDFVTDNTVAYQMDNFASTNYGKNFISKNKSFFDVIRQNYIEQFVHPDDKFEMFKFCTKENVSKELNCKKSCSICYRVKRGGDDYQYYRLNIIKVGNSEGIPKSAIFGFINFDEQMANESRLRIAVERENILKIKTEKLSEDAYIDVLTGLLNRRAYEEDAYKGITFDVASNCIFITADVNGLKNVNDSQGHDAGDELIKGAAFCLKASFGNFGKIYRIGGDEFSAVVYIDADKLSRIQGHFENTVNSWSGNLVKELSISIGYAPKFEFPEAMPTELTKLADKRMYQDKSRYYARKGVDRRGSNDIYRSLRDSYIMVLKVDLSSDSYWVIRTDLSGVSDVPYSVTECFNTFINNNSLHPCDVDRFASFMNIKYLSSYFKTGKKVFSILYKRKMTSGEYRNTFLEMRRTDDYTDENQLVHMFVKDLDEEEVH